jgi:eight-cysteine-cluster-containing protein
MSILLRRLSPTACTILLVLSGACVCKHKSAETGPPPGAPVPDVPAPATAPASPGAPARTPAVPADHPERDLVEGKNFRNQCASDGECHIGGCSREICSAEAGVNSICIMKDWPTAGASCGCVAGECIWYHATGPGADTPAPAESGHPRPGDGGSAPAALAGQGQPCSPDGRCRDGLRCVKYHGIAGAAGPTFTSCEIQCTDKGARCPPGQQCVTIADGPGQVCR